MQTPGTMSASTAVDVRVKVVVLERVTVRSPVGPVRMSDCPLICTSWPEAPLGRNWGPPRAARGAGRGRRGVRGGRGASARDSHQAGGRGRQNQHAIHLFTHLPLLSPQ